MSPIKLSPTQVELWNLCPRKWGYKYLEKRETTPHPSARVGLRVHKILEEYLLEGIAPDRYEELKIGKTTYYPGRIAIKMAEHLPPAGSCTAEEIEKHFTIEIAGILFQGYKDLRKSGKVWDHKTTSDLKYAKTPDELRKDPQALIYGLDELQEKVECQWTYGQTKGKERAKKVTLTLLPEEILAGLEKHVLPTAREIIKAYDTRPDVKSLAYNVRACDKYGGCPFIRDCNLTAKERIRGIMDKNELMAKLKAKKAAAESAPAPQSEPEAAPEKKPNAALEKLKAKKAAASAAPGATGINPKGEAAPAGSTPAETPAPEAPKTPVKKTFDLFVDCEPVSWKGKIMRLETLLEPAAESVCEDLGIPNYRLAEFGKGPACLSAQLKDNLTNGPLPEGTALLMSLRTNEGRDVYQALFELAKTVTVAR